VNSETSVLVTGASTGIGRATALHLADLGMKVYAGVRRDEDAADLEQQGPVIAVRLDVTSSADVDDIAQRIEADGGLDGLVNNAGVYLGGALELMRDDEIESTFAVNVVGLLRVTRACLPMLRERRGRIVNVSSISGLVALPGVSVYAGSKHAVEAISDALRVELSTFGVRVIAVEPGSIDTAIWSKGARRDQASSSHSDAALRELYSPLQHLLEKLNRNPRGIPPTAVATVIGDALTARNPDNRYLVGTDARSLALLRYLPEGLRDRLIGTRVWRD